MLTYETLSKIVKEEKEEKSHTRLVSLQPNFFNEVREYLDTKSRMAQGKDDLWELNSARRMLQDMLDTREKKILSAALYFPRTGAEPENMTKDEKEFFGKVVRHLEELQSTRKAMLENREKMSMVAMLADVPEFVGLDLKNYGPYREGDIATVPEENAKVLVQKNAAKIIEAV